MLGSQSIVELVNLRTGDDCRGSARKPLLLRDLTYLRLLPGDELSVKAHGENAEEVVAALAEYFTDKPFPGFTVHKTACYREHVARATAAYYGAPRYLDQDGLMEFAKDFEQWLLNRRSGNG